MAFKLIERKTGEFTNYDADFKSMELNEEVVVKPVSVVKEGESKFGKWYLFKMEINGKDCAGFGVGSKMVQSFLNNLGTTLVVKKIMYKDLKNNDKVGYDITPQSPAPKLGGLKPKFQFKENDLKDDDGVYSDKDAIDFLRQNGNYDVLTAYETLWVQFGSTAARGKDVFEHRKEL